MEQSILTSTKKVLHIGPDDTSFDLDVMTHINSAFSDLNDLGLGPAEGFGIEDDQPEWADFSTNSIERNRVKTFVFLYTKLRFDPPQMPHLLEASRNQLEEVTWRLNVAREATEWVDPDPPVAADYDPLEEVIAPNFDGGGAG